MVSFTDHYDDISIDRLPWKIKIGKDSCTLIIVFYLSPISPQLQITFFILLKTQTNNDSSASDWWEYTKFCLKASDKIFLKNSTTQENITMSRQNFILWKTQKSTTLQQVTGKETQNLVLMRILELFLKVPPLKKMLKL